MTSPEGPIDYLTLEDLLQVAGGVIDHLAVRDLGLLASAVARPETTAFGDDAYPTFPGKAAALMHSLARNHALVDGNKRLAWSATRVFCLLNGQDLTYTVDEAENLVVGVAAGNIDMPQLTDELTQHLR